MKIGIFFLAKINNKKKRIFIGFILWLFRFFSGFFGSLSFLFSSAQNFFYYSSLFFAVFVCLFVYLCWLVFLIFQSSNHPFDDWLTDNPQIWIIIIVTNSLTDWLIDLLTLVSSLISFEDHPNWMIFTNSVIINYHHHSLTVLSSRFFSFSIVLYIMYS